MHPPYLHPAPILLSAWGLFVFQESAAGSGALEGTVSGSSKRTVTITKLSNGNGFLAIPKCHSSQ